ncbi:tryptophan synthase subunit alpha [Candidatus Formimonas warabiya]|uniref:Tryptophan synthase alpha chain n=1 Tax=Formimonas warabiya TaxID=1761012 RepID=A0A3G1KPM4_FORW1|nr:tryptophan synthase subunit alpha [Candidatus Formimonas warabiya]ATW24380.1 tryptophan synthase subunit alpha [Candidatus Formimonas warabiya]
MNRIDYIFGELDRKKEKALIPYVCCGDPTVAFTEELVVKLAESGADLIELGVPYSDPVADGPTVQKASVRALAGKITLDKIFSLAARVRQKTQIPLLIMTYYNPVYVMGVDHFIEQGRAAGVDGLIIPDLPLEEAGPVQEALEKKGMNLIFLATPTSTSDRLKKIARLAQGFIYCVSVTGVTGARQDISDQLSLLVKRLRQETRIPLAAGFGISGPENARKAAALADGVIVGSALIDRMEQSLTQHPEDYHRAMKEGCSFVKTLKSELRRGEAVQLAGRF